MMLALYVAFLFYFTLVISSPVRPEPRVTSLPTITLPYGIFQAASYSAVSDMLVRFANWSSPAPNNANQIRLQEYSLRCTTSRGSQVAKAGSSAEQDRNTRWQLRPELSSSGHLRPQRFWSRQQFSFRCCRQSIV